MDYASDNEAGITNTYDLQYNRGPSDYDVTHTFSSSWVYEAPWGRGELWGGWQLSGILYLRGGLPLTVTQSQGVQSTGTGNRPNRHVKTCGRFLNIKTELTETVRMRKIYLRLIGQI